MRTLITHKGTYKVDFAWAPNNDGSCLIHMVDDRRIPEIAAEFDGLQSIHYFDAPAGRDYEWKGYSKLANIITVREGIVQITLRQEQ